MKLKLEKQSSYGRTRIYPACDKSKLLAELAKRTCFDDESIEILKKLGYSVTIKGA